MTDLITRLSKLDAPDREVDGEIWRYLMSGEPRAVLHGPIPKLTASVDAAIALAERVLPGWGWEIASNTNHIKNCLNPEYGKPIGKHPHWAVVANQSSRKFVDGQTPAIALCIALLRAKEASKP